MPSELRSETARINGARSNGPVTAEGRANSSRNAIRHGLTAKTLVLPTESVEEFHDLLDDYIDHFQPQTGVELDLVQTLVTTRWRLDRLCNVETGLLDQATGDHENTASAFKKMANTDKSLPLLMRYEGSLNRAYDRAFKQLHQLQSAKPRVQRDEPSPSQTIETEPLPTPNPATPPPTVPIPPPVGQAVSRGALWARVVNPPLEVETSAEDAPQPEIQKTRRKNPRAVPT